jgi:hypothetical protein
VADGDVIAPPDRGELVAAHERIAAALDPVRGAPVARPFSDRELGATVALGLRLGLPLGVVVDVIEDVAAEPPGGLIRAPVLLARRLRDAAKFRDALGGDEIARRERADQPTWRPPATRRPSNAEVARRAAEEFKVRKRGSNLVRAAASLAARYDAG